MVKLVNLHEQDKKLHSVTKEFYTLSRDLELDLQNDEEVIPTVIAKKTKQKAKELGLKQIAVTRGKNCRC